MGYYIDLESISMEKSKEILQSSDLLPSRIILKNGIEENFNLIKNRINPLLQND